jgi:ApbE superfamily uncharacterized protein (UPF0280 family)
MIAGINTSRFYREKMNCDRCTATKVIVADSDLWIGYYPHISPTEVERYAFERLLYYRELVETYIATHIEFARSFEPVVVPTKAHDIIKKMAQAGKHANVGPMAAVAGAIAEYVGIDLLTKFKLDELVVENGGDIFMKVNENVNMSLYAGESSLSEKVGLTITAGQWGVCTSAGTVGHSHSFGKADAVMIVSESTLLADAYATAIANTIKSKHDIQTALDFAKTKPQIVSCLIVCEETLGNIGQYDICFF